MPRRRPQTPTDLGFNVRMIREARGWTQRELARRCDPPWPAIDVSHIERGYMLPARREAVRVLAKALGVHERALERRRPPLPLLKPVDDPPRLRYARIAGEGTAAANEVQTPESARR
jgi:transcriptional regulator with XRE-family HTH domain